MSQPTFKSRATPSQPKYSPLAAHPSTKANRLPQYLHRRGSTYYFKRKIPRSALPAFPEYREQVWKSLDTDVLVVAKARLAVELTEFNLRLAAFERQQALEASQPYESRPNAQADHAVEPAVLHAAPRSTPAQIRDACLSVPRQSQPPQTSYGHRSSAEPAEPPGRHAPARGRVTKVAKPRVERYEKTAVAPVKRGFRHTMLHLFEDWKHKQTRHRTVSAVQSVVMEFRQLHGPIAVEDITRPMVRAYRDHLLDRGLSKGTIENRIGFLSTLVRHGMVELVEHLAINPFERIQVVGAAGQNPGKSRRSYEISELNLLYTSKLYTQGYRPRGQAADAAYWLPLMGPFVGARIEELCQLTIADVQCVNNVWCLRICNLEEDQSIKTVGSYRRVPLHEELVRCGFLRYVAAMAAAGHRRVFPTLQNDNANRIYSNAVGKWYGRYLDTVGLSDPRLDYHSFRYLFKQRCSLCGVDTEVRDALTGHWSSDNNAGRVYLRAEERQYPFPKLVQAMHTLAYEELRLEHLYVDNPFKGVEEHLKS
jgi:integrase